MKKENDTPIKILGLNEADTRRVIVLSSNFGRAEEEQIGREKTALPIVRILFFRGSILGDLTISKKILMRA